MRCSSWPLPYYFTPQDHELCSGSYPDLIGSHFILIFSTFLISEVKHFHLKNKVFFGPQQHFYFLLSKTMHVVS